MAKREMQKGKKKGWVTGVIVAAILLLSIGLYSFNKLQSNTLVVSEDGSITIPPMKLPKGDLSAADMVGLIVYNGSVYTQTDSTIDANDAKAIIGEKLGSTKGTIDEWSSKEAYNEEFASTIGSTDVYSVEGYDPDFRIMSYSEVDGQSFAEIFEKLNGITVHTGKDLFGKLKMDTNVAEVKYRTLSDWDLGIDNFQSIQEQDVLNRFVENLNETKPLPRSEPSDPIREMRTDEEFRELIIRLTDGTQVSLTLLKSGYIYYGSMPVYFEMNQKDFSEIWELIQ